jgi:hypothetical protein
MLSSIARRVQRPSTALLVAFAALFTALSGTGYAALKITGADIQNNSIGPKKLKLDSIGGKRIKESKLGTVPSAENAQHAATADTATQAAKAADADTIDGIDSSSLMTSKPRLFEVNVGDVANFGDNATLGTLADVPAGSYLVTAKLVYDNDGATASESCTLHVPGADDETHFLVESAQSHMVVLEEAVTAASAYSASVSCTSDADDDMLGTMTIIATRVD